jgi:hypothetical protein
MDSDDESLPERLGTQVQFLTDHPSVAVVGSWAWHMGATRAYDKLVRLPYTPKELARHLPNGNCLYHPSVMFRRQEILALGGYSPEFPHAEDYELWLRTSRSHQLANIPRPLLRYRVSSGGITYSRRWELLASVLLAQQKFAHPDFPWADLKKAAKEALSKIDRASFFAEVIQAGIHDLLQLHQFQDATRLLEFSAKELDTETCKRLKLQILQAAEERS